MHPENVTVMVLVLSGLGFASLLFGAVAEWQQGRWLRLMQGPYSEMVLAAVESPRAAAPDAEELERVTAALLARACPPRPALAATG